MDIKSIILTIAAILFSAATSLSQPKNVYNVYALEYFIPASRGTVSDIAVGSDSKDSISFAYYFWFLNGDNGKKVLVDVGLIQDYSHPMKGNNYVRPDSLIQRINITPDDITDIIITHPHFDHIDGLSLFKTGTVWIQKDDYTYFVGDGWQKGGDNRGFNKGDVLKIVKANLAGRVNFINGDNIEIIPGIRVFTGSKHTFGSQHLVVDTKTDKVLLASDDSWFYYNLEHELPIPLVLDAEAYTVQLKKMKTLIPNKDLIIPGHDPLVMKRFPEVAEGVVKIR
jgi:glyoxylase-like metal-dependent hydrolase (beta-lactamase superfamily II)